MKATPTHQKLRGGYYTPDPIAHFLAQWAIQSPTAEVLEPSCGDGALLEAAVNVLVERGAAKPLVAGLVHGIELDPVEAQRTETRLRALGIPYSSEQLYVGDFFAYCKAQLLQEPFFTIGPSVRRSFDAIIGNPPFIRYQNFPKEYQKVAFELMRYAGLRPNRLTNTWVPFLVVSTLLLSEHGRLAMVIPAELLQVNYASEVREFLGEFYGQITLVLFRGLVFDGIQQEVLLFLGDRNGQERHGIRTIEVTSVEDLLSHRWDEPGENELKPISHGTEKWTQYFLRDDQRKALREAMNNNLITRLGQLCSVDVGVVTGKNRFFVLSKDDALKLEAQNHLLPVVTRTRYLQGLIFREHDWRGNVDTNRPSYLLAIKDASDFSESLRKYITSGEEKNWHKNYKCSIRRLWYVVPSIWIPDAFLSRKIGSFPRLVLNSAEATCTDNLLRVKFKRTGFERIITTCFHNSLTSAFAEIFGRSYGGGVLELMPTEAEKLPVPIPKSNSKSLFSEMDKLIREGLQEEAIELCDQRVLIEELGCKKENIAIIKSAWRKLSKRRKSRHRRNLIHSQPIYN